MSLQYISDTQGRHTAVVISIEDWNRITARHEDLKTLEAPRKKPSDFRGAISAQTAEQLLNYVEQSRTEWESRIS